MKSFKMTNPNKTIEQHCRFGNGYVEICSRDHTGREVVIRHNFGANLNGMGSTRIIRPGLRKLDR